MFDEQMVGICVKIHTWNLQNVLFSSANFLNNVSEFLEAYQKIIQELAAKKEREEKVAKKKEAQENSHSPTAVPENKGKEKAELP